MPFQFNTLQATLRLQFHVHVAFHQHCQGWCKAMERRGGRFRLKPFESMQHQTAPGGQVQRPGLEGPKQNQSLGKGCEIGRWCWVRGLHFLRQRQSNKRSGWKWTKRFGNGSNQTRGSASGLCWLGLWDVGLVKGQGPQHLVLIFAW